MKHLFMFLVVLFSWSTVDACDVCGCSSSGNSLGILPQFNKHFIGLVTQFQEFQSTHAKGVGEQPATLAKDKFSSFTAWARLYPHPKFQVFAFVPFHYNQVEEQGQKTTLQGLGDIKLLVNYMLLQPEVSNNQWRHSLLVGGGVKLPTGKYNIAREDGLIVSNMQPGTGSWDFIVNANYTVRYHNIGLNSDMMAQINTVNNRDYLYGNKLNAGLSLFYWQEVKQVTLLPQIGVRTQYSSQDWSSYSYRIVNEFSGGYQVYTTLGLSAYYKHIGISTIGYFPTAENYAHGLVKAKPRLECQIQFLF